MCMHMSVCEYICVCHVYCTYHFPLTSLPFVHSFIHSFINIVCVCVICFYYHMRVYIYIYTHTVHHVVRDTFIHSLLCSFKQKGAAGAYYSPAPLDGSRPATFYCNLQNVCVCVCLCVCVFVFVCACVCDPFSLCFSLFSLPHAYTHSLTYSLSSPNTHI